MKKTQLLLLTVILVVSFCILGVVIAGSSVLGEERFTLSMQIGNPIMTVNGTEMEIDPGRGTVPVVQNGRTLVPIRSIIEAMGGSVAWDEETQTVFLAYNGDIITLAIGNTTAYLNETANSLDTPPVQINNRTMLPIRFIAESYQFGVEWDADNAVIAITKTAEA